MPSKLEERFIMNCREYAESLGVVGRADETNEGDVATFFSLSLSYIKLQLVYLKEGVPSTLFVRVYLNKNSSTFFHLPELLSFLELDDFRACYFPCIESEERLDACFNALTDILNDHIEEFESLARNYRAEEVRKYQFESFKNIWGLSKLGFVQEIFDDDDLYSETLEFVEELVFIRRYTEFSEYQNLCNGKTQKAIKQYKKLIDKNKAYPYEKRLFEFISKPENADFSPMNLECCSYKIAKEYVYRPKITSAKGYLLSMVCTFALFTVAFLITNFIFGRGTTEALGISWTIGITLLAISVASLGFAVGYSDKINRIINDERTKEIRAFKNIIESTKERNAFQILGRSVAMIMLLLSIWNWATVTRLYDSYFVSTTATNAVKTEKFEYANIDKIYYMKSRYNAYGEIVSRPSYVLSFDDGRIYDFDLCSSEKEIKEKLFPLLEDYDLDIVTVENEKEIPDYEKYNPKE